MKPVFRTTVFTLALVCSGIFATAQKPTTALALNDYLVSITDSLYKAGQA